MTRISNSIIMDAQLCQPLSSMQKLSHTAKMFFQSVVCAHITIVAECQTNTKSSEHVHPSHMCLEQTIVLTRHMKTISSEQFSSQEQRAKCKVPAGITSPYHTIQKTAKARSKLKGSVAYSSDAAASRCQGAAVNQEARKH